MAGRRAALLDRDGVINVDRGYVHRWTEFEFVPGAIDAMARLHEGGYLLAVVTNQSGIARGYYTEADLAALNAEMSAFLAARGAPLAGIYACPHLPGAPVAAYAIDCDCRKPKAGLIRQAEQALGLHLGRSFLAGDKPSDIAAARAAGVGRAYLIGTGAAPAADGRFPDLAACAGHVLGLR